MDISRSANQRSVATPMTPMMQPQPYQGPHPESPMENPLRTLPHISLPYVSDPSVSLPNSRPAIPHHWRRGSAASRHGWRNLHTLQPRPLEELQNEQAYLLANLQRQDSRARRLLAHLTAIESHRMPVAKSVSELRRLRREATGARNKIADAAQQERLTLMRLGDVQVELRSRERWCQVQMEQQQQQQQQGVAVVPPAPFVPSPIALSPAGWVLEPVSPWSMANMWSPISPLSPLAPGSFPWPQAGGGSPWAVAGVGFGGQLPDGNPLPVPRMQEKERRYEAPKLEFIFAGFEEDDSSDAGARQQNCHRRSVSLDAEDKQPAAARGKRLSLPTLRLVWPEPADVSE